MLQSDAADQHGLLFHQALSLVEKYDGRDDALAWLDSVNTLAELYYWTKDVCLRVARLCMKGAARRWIHQRRFNDWDDFQDQFVRRFGETRESAVARLSRCYQGHSESIKAFADRFLEDAERAGRTEDAALVYQFLGKLRPDLRREAARKQPQSIDDIVDFCNYWLGAMAEEGDYSLGRGSFVPGPERRARFAEPLDDEAGHYTACQPSGYEQHHRRPSFRPPSRFTGKSRDRLPPRFNDRPLSSSHNVNQGPRNSNHPNIPSSRPAQAASAAPAAPATSAADIEALTKSYQRLELHLQDKEKEIRHLRYALQQQYRQHPAPSQFNYMAAGPAGSAIEQLADMPQDVGFECAAADEDSDYGSRDEPLMLSYLQLEQLDSSVYDFEPDSNSRSEELITDEVERCMRPAAQSCCPLETTVNGDDKCFNDTDQHTQTEPLRQETTATSAFLVPVGAQSIPEGCAPAYYAPASQPLELSSLILEGLIPPPAEEATQEKIPLCIGLPGSKLRCHTALANDEKDNCSRWLVPDGQLYHGKQLIDPVCWQPSTTVPSVPPLPWPPPCLIDSEWWGVMCGPT